MTNKEILDIAMQQSAYDINAKVSDFHIDTNVFVKSEVGPAARKYYKEPIACNLVSYGNNVVASVKDEYRDIVETYLSKFEFYHCFETPNLAMEIIDRGKVPFYCCAWSNLKSVKNALRSGFVPGWVEMTVKAASLVEDMNK